MAIDAKISFLHQMEKALSTEITADSMNRALRAAADVLEGFSMREVDVIRDEDDDMLDSYLSTMEVEGKSPKTLRNYRYNLKRILDSIGVSSRRVTIYHLRNYLAREKQRGLSDCSLNNQRNILCSYFGWLFRENLIERDPCANLGSIKCAKKQKKPFTEEEMEKLRANCKSIRDLAIVNFLAASGCRISEAVALNRNDIDFRGLEFVVRGKGNKERTVYIDPATALQLQRYLHDRKDDNPALFIGNRGERLGDNGVRFILRELAKRAGVEHVHPHKFRRTLGTELGAHGMPIQEISVLLGHERIDTTMQYVVVNKEEVKHDYRKYA